MIELKRWGVQNWLIGFQTASDLAYLFQVLEVDRDAEAEMAAIEKDVQENPVGSSRVYYLNEFLEILRYGAGYHSSKWDTGEYLQVLTPHSQRQDARFKDECPLTYTEVKMKLSSYHQWLEEEQ